MRVNNGGPAFPHLRKPVAPGVEQVITDGGMTLRDYFAAKAIGVMELPTDYVGIKETEESYKRWAQKAYRMADAMLKARE
ncbi:hypothetical protein [Enterobacter hormaechei]|uniref:hypothetical protein n=1 Tax=Enterobacter hormaechei TaxID=158836 RepID=UPI001D06EBDB|nr:hypothetical protein [Enterobacter hormaechei]